MTLSRAAVCAAIVLAFLSFAISTARAWEFSQEPFTDGRTSCWGTTVFQSPQRGLFGLVAYESEDGLPIRIALLAFVEKPRGLDFGEDGGELDLGISIDDEPQIALTGRYSLTSSDARITIEDPPYSLLLALQRGATLTISPGGGIEPVQLSLTGSSRALDQMQACTADLSANSAVAERAFVETIGSDMASEWSANALDFAGWNAFRSERTGFCYALLVTGGVAGLGLVSDQNGLGRIIVSSDSIITDQRAFGWRSDVSFPADIRLGNAQVTVAGQYGTSPPDSMNYVSVFSPTETLLQLLAAAPQFRLSVDGQEIDGIPTSVSGGSFKDAVAEWLACTRGETAKPVAAAPTPEPSPPSEPAVPGFCERPLSAVQTMICEDEELSRLEIALDPLYAAARARAEAWGYIGARTALWWLEGNARTDLALRETTCTDRECLLRWYLRREAILSWIAESEIGFGDAGIEDIRVLDNQMVWISYNMATHKGNVLWVAGTFENLPDGELEFLVEDPLIYRVTGQKAYFVDGGAFWFDTIRDGQHRIIAIPPAEEDSLCMSKNEFILRTSFSVEDLALVPEDEICVSI